MIKYFINAQKQTIMINIPCFKFEKFSWSFLVKYFQNNLCAIKNEQKMYLNLNNVKYFLKKKLRAFKISYLP